MNKICTVGIVVLIVCFTSIVYATPAETPKFPAPFDYEINTIKSTNDSVGADFEYQVFVTPNVNIEDIEIFISWNEEGINLDGEPERYKGRLKAGQKLSWNIKGQVTQMIKLENYPDFFPVLRLEAKYFYPYEEIKALIEKNFSEASQERVEGFSLEETLMYLESIFKDRDDKIFFNKIWSP